MAKLKSILFITLLCFNFAITAQEEQIHQKINDDIYHNFSKAFETLDYQLFSSIHSKDMIRISGNGGEIKDAATYLEGYQKRWSDANSKPAPIDFRLFERILSESVVSDRGIYRVTYTNDSDNQKKYSYGQFHLLLRLENDTWKISIDYDSNENKSIDKESYDTAFPLSAYKKHWKSHKK